MNISYIELVSYHIFLGCIQIRNTWPPMAAATFVWKWFVILFEVISTCPLENTASPPRSTFGTSPVNHHHHHHELTPDSRKTPYSKTYNAPNVTRLIFYNEAEKLQLTISSDLTLNMCLSPRWFAFGLREKSKKWLWIGSVGVNVKSSRWSKRNKKVWPHWRGQRWPPEDPAPELPSASLFVLKLISNFDKITNGDLSHFSS